MGIILVLAVSAEVYWYSRKQKLKTDEVLREPPCIGCDAALSHQATSTEEAISTTLPVFLMPAPTIPMSVSEPSAPKLEGTKPTPILSPTIVIPEKAPPASGSGGHHFTFSGAVFDSTNAGMSDGTPLSGVTVSVSGPRMLSTQTQSNGQFTLSLYNAPVGTYTTCITPPNGFTFPSAGDPPCEEVTVELLTDGTTLVFTYEGNKAYYTGTQFNFYGIRK